MKLTLDKRSLHNRKAEVDPPVKKVISGDKPRTDSTFTFRMEADDPLFPMPEGSVHGRKEATVQGEGEVEFGFSTYTEAGIFTYKVYEQKETITGYTFDKTMYTMTVTVTESDGELAAKRVILRDDGRTVDEMLFTNAYRAPDKGTLQPGRSRTVAGATVHKRSVSNSPKTGDTSNITLFIVLGIAAMMLILLIRLFSHKKQREDSGSVNQDGN